METETKGNIPKRFLESQKFTFICQTRRSFSAKYVFRTDEGFIDQGGCSVRAPNPAEFRRQKHTGA